MNTNQTESKPQDVEAPTEEGLDETTCSPTWRSFVFWNADIEDVMDRIANEAMGYHPDSRQAFFGDVIAAIHSHLEND